ncbi:hypothetical protein TNCV_4464631 [Trichonephila clavipes]|nr:hypothetical protein TNCV_4464631 [Trichonephila clavipes]
MLSKLLIKALSRSKKGLSPVAEDGLPVGEREIISSGLVIRLISSHRVLIPLNIPIYLEKLRHLKSAETQMLRLGVGILESWFPAHVSFSSLD